MPLELAFQVNNDRQHHTIQLENLKFRPVSKIKAEKFILSFLFLWYKFYFASAQKILYCTGMADLKYSLTLERSEDALCLVK